MQGSGSPLNTTLPRSWWVASLGGVVLLGAGLRLWALQRNGFGTEYYAAGVFSMMASWHNFFFVAFDPAGFLSIDKPPIALWLQVASAELFGFDGLSLLLPQVVEGLISILLLYWLVVRRFGEVAGLLAAAVLATMPVSVAVDRSNNTDSCLVLVLLLTAAAAIRAAERRSFAWLLMAMACVGVGFNVKMAAAFGIVPACCLAYLLARPWQWPLRLVHVIAAGAVALIVGFSWFTAFDLVPADERPYAGSTTDNSMMQMVFVQYGVNRFIPHPWREQRRGAVAQTTANGGPGSPAASGFAADRVPIGPLRLADPRLGGQVGWFFPLAVFGVAALTLGRRRNQLLETPDIVLWAGWAITYAVVFSFAGGIFHAYYLVAMAPPVAALTGAGIVALWAEYRRGGGTNWLLPAALAITGLWQAWLEHEAIGSGLADWRTALFALLLVGTAMGTCGLIAASRRNLPRLALPSLCVGLVAASAIPLAWALSTVLGEGNVSFPAADIALLAPASERSEHATRTQRWTRNLHLDDDRFLAYLRENRGAAEFLLATQTAQQAAPIILKTGAPVMAAGGYSGSDPIVTPDSLGALVAAGRVRFFLIREGGRGGGNPDGQARQIADWVKAHGQLVDPEIWRPTDVQAHQGDFALYDLHNPTTAAN